MPAYYAKRALEILREQGPLELYERSHSYIYSKARNRFTNQLNLARYILYYSIYSGSTPHPSKIIKLNPKDITHAVSCKFTWYPISSGLKELQETKPYYSDEFLKYWGQYAILDGSWDKSSVPMERIYHVKGLVERFVEGKKWRETSEYTWHRELGRDEKKIKNYFQSREKLYKSIQEDGFNSDYPIEVCIGRDGEILRSDGNHRITISKILGINEIPAKVSVRHRQWQELRDEIHNNGLPEEHGDLRNHPDLQDVIDE